MTQKTRYEWRAGRVNVSLLIFLVRHAKNSISVSINMYIPLYVMYECMVCCMWGMSTIMRNIGYNKYG